MGIVMERKQIAEQILFRVHLLDGKTRIIHIVCVCSTVYSVVTLLYKRTD